MEEEWINNPGCYYFRHPKSHFIKWLLQEYVDPLKPEDYLLPGDRHLLEEPEPEPEPIKITFPELNGRKIRANDLQPIKTNKNHWRTHHNRRHPK